MARYADNSKRENMNNNPIKIQVGMAEKELRDIKLYDGMTARVPVGTVVVKAYFDGWYQAMRCFVPRGGGYNPRNDATRYMNELRMLGVAAFLEAEEITPSPTYQPINPDGVPQSEIPIELTDEADKEEKPTNTLF